jgi:hypothetical protein
VPVSIGLPRCERCRRGFVSTTVIGPKRKVGLCDECLRAWHSFRDLIYGAQERGPFDS